MGGRASSRAAKTAVQSNGVFSFLSKPGRGLPEQRIAGTRSLPALDTVASGLSRSRGIKRRLTASVSDRDYGSWSKKARS